MFFFRKSSQFLSTEILQYFIVFQDFKKSVGFVAKDAFAQAFSDVWLWP